MLSVLNLSPTVKVVCACVFNIYTAASIFRWLMIQRATSSRAIGFLSVARGDARGEQRQQTSPSYLAAFFQDNTWIWIIKVQSRWENVNEPRDKRGPALIWWRRNEEPAKLSQDHVRADTWETDEVEAIVLIWMQIRRDGERKQGRWPTSSQARFVAGGMVGSAGGHRLRCCLEILRH